jgi:hypothetical protein
VLHKRRRQLRSRRHPSIRHQPSSRRQPSNKKKPTVGPRVRQPEPPSEPLRETLAGARPSEPQSAVRLRAMPAARREGPPGRVAKTRWCAPPTGVAHRGWEIRRIDQRWRNHFLPHPSQNGADSSASDPALFGNGLDALPCGLHRTTLWRSTITAGWAGIAAGYRTRRLTTGLKGGSLKDRSEPRHRLETLRTQKMRVR